MELRLGFAATGEPCHQGGDALPACLVKRWTKWLEQSGADYPSASRGLAEIGDALASVESARFMEHVGLSLDDAAVKSELESFLDFYKKAHLHQGQGLIHMREAVRAAVPAISLRTHILREAAKFTERVDGAGESFLKALQELLAKPFDEEPQELTRSSDDPKEAWRKLRLSALDASLVERDGPDATVLNWLRARLQARPPLEMQQLRTSCGAQ